MAGHALQPRFALRDQQAIARMGEKWERKLVRWKQEQDLFVVLLCDVKLRRSHDIQLVLENYSCTLPAACGARRGRMRAYMRPDTHHYLSLLPGNADVRWTPSIADTAHAESEAHS